MWLWLLAPVIAAVPYALDTWWKFIPSTIGLLAAVRLIRPGDYLDVLGLRVSLPQALLAVCLLAFATLIGRSLIFSVTGAHGYQYYVEHWPFSWRLLPIFQAFNEEVFFRAISLSLLLNFVSNRFLVVTLPAGAFALAHWWFYATFQSTWLHPGALLSLFAFGLAANVLFVSFRHIWYGYALHLGWNASRFTGEYLHGETGQWLHEGAGFNLIEGSPVVVAFSLAIAALSLGWLGRARTSG